MAIARIQFSRQYEKNPDLKARWFKFLDRKNLFIDCRLTGFLRPGKVREFFLIESQRKINKFVIEIV